MRGRASLSSIAPSDEAAGSLCTITRSTLPDHERIFAPEENRGRGACEGSLRRGVHRQFGETMETSPPVRRGRHLYRCSGDPIVILSTFTSFSVNSTKWSEESPRSFAALRMTQVQIKSPARSGTFFVPSEDQLPGGGRNNCV